MSRATHLASLLLLLALGSEVAADETRRAREYVGGLAAGRAWEQDPGGRSDLQGYRIAFTAISQASASGYGHAGSWYVEWKESGDQEVLEAGVELAYPYFEFSRFAFGPRVRVALQERDRPPDRGTDGVLGLGFEFGVWLSERVQLALVADRGIGFEAGARTAYSANLRVMLWKD